MNTAIIQLKQFKTKKMRLSCLQDFKYLGNVVFNGKWIEFRIKSWNELLIHCFGEVNQKR